MSAQGSQEALAHAYRAGSRLGKDSNLVGISYSVLGVAAHFDDQVEEPEKEAVNGVLTSLYEKGAVTENGPEFDRGDYIN